MRNSRDGDLRFEKALWGHGRIVLAVCVLAVLISFPTGW
jgi:hypothetical protein